jgi:signal transduction histidine kinase
MAADRRQLEALDEQRRKLLANIAHELATPLTSIRGFSETLLDPAIAVSEAERREYLGRIRGEAERLDLLTRDLLDLARLESGTVPLAVAPLDWAELCRNTVERFAPRFAAAGLALRWMGPLAEARIEGDGRRLEQVLENLLANALRYVPAGGSVEVRLDPPAAGAGAGAFALTVDDDGPGIAAGDLAQLFDRFYRADAARSTPGSGLGLAIVREIVQRHGGEVRAGNREPRGARFVVELPGAPPPAGPASCP